MKDEKYVVFKREEFEHFTNWFNAGMPTEEDFWADPIEDAVVIRKQDLFAGPALHAYASSIQTVIELLESLSINPHLTEVHGLTSQQVFRLREVRDYFFQQALEADDVRNKKVPD